MLSDSFQKQLRETFSQYAGSKISFDEARTRVNNACVDERAPYLSSDALLDKVLQESSSSIKKHSSLFTKLYRA